METESKPACILVTGASSDIGRELIRRIASPETLVLAHYNRSPAGLEALRDSLPGSRIVPVRADFASEEGVPGLIAQIRDNHPAPEAVVHLPAPKFEYVRFKDASWDAFQKNIDVQLRSIVGILKEYLPAMAQKKKGKVVFVLSSVNLNIPPGSLTHYVTAKYALLGLARSLASEYSSKKININSVSPSMVETAFLENLPERMVEIAASQTPWQRNATPGDVAGAIRFLLSPDADYITGVNLPVAGGTAY